MATGRDWDRLVRHVERGQQAQARGVGPGSAKLRGLAGATYGPASQVRQLSSDEKQAVIDRLRREGKL
jgi:hypothetical protein